MEPLLERGYSKIEPVLIPPYGGVDGQQIPQSPSSLNNVDPTLPPAGILHFLRRIIKYQVCVERQLFALHMYIHMDNYDNLPD